MRIDGQSRCISWYVSCAVVVLGLALPSVTHAANRYWVGNDGASTNVASNWKTTDPAACGSGDASAAPVSGDVIIFDRDCDNGAIIDSALTVTTTTFQNGYSGTVTLHTSFTTTTFTQSGGTFKLNGQTWTNAGAITLNTGSTFTAGTGTLTLTGGAVTINADSTLTLYNLIINSTGTKTIANSDSLIITNTLTLTDGLVSQSTIPTAGTLRAQGAIVQASTFDGGTARIVADGTGDQTFTGNATRTAGLLPLFKIDKVSGTLTLSGTIRTASAWGYSGGTLAFTNNTVVFGDGALTIAGSHSLSNVIFDQNAVTARTYTIKAGDTLTVLGNLTIDNSNDTLGSGIITINGGFIHAKGDIFLPDSVMNHTGTTWIYINGTGNQILSGNASNSTGGLMNVNINKASGTLTLSGTIRTVKTWSYSGGTLASGNSTVVFGATQTIAGSHTLNNVRFDNYKTAMTVTITAPTTLTVNGSLTMDQEANLGLITINGGFIRAKGNISSPDSHANHTGTTWLYIDGTSDQTLTGAASNSTGGLINVNINKASGTLTLSGTIRTVKTWSYSGGTLASGNSTVVFGATQTIAGSHTLNNVRFDNYKTAMTVTITAPTTLTVNGSLTMDQEANLGLITINGGFIRAKGNISSPDSHANHTGTTWLYIDGTSDQTLTGAASNSTGGLINVNINKASGTLTLAGTIRTPKTWSYSGGTLDAGSSTVVFGGTVTIAGSHTLNNVRFDNYKTAMTVTITAATTLTVNGTLTIDQGGDAAIITINTGSINAKGDINAPDTLNHTGTATITIGGTGSQSFTGGASATAGSIPNININKTSGTLTLLGTIRTVKSWSYTSGTLDPGTSTLVFTGSSIRGSHSLNNVTFNGIRASIASGTTLIVTGTLTLSDGTINFGIVSAQASVVHAQGFDGGNATLLLSGSATRTITFAGSGSLPNLSLTAANTSVGVSGSGPLNIEGNFHQSAGTFTAPAVLKVAQSFHVTGGTFNHNNGTVILSGIDRVFLPPSELNNLTINRNEHLLGYWKLDDGSTETTIRDSSGNANHGTWVGPLGSNTAPVWATPTHESSFTNTGALSLDDTDDRVALGTFQRVKTGMLWFTVRSLAATKNLLQDGTTFLLQMEEDHPLIYYGGSIVASSPIILVDEWHHMALVYDGTGAVFYFDGINYGIRKSIAEISSVNLGLGYSTVSGQPAKGLLDDVRVYNRALSPNEIRAIAQGQDTKYSLAGDLSLAGTLTLEKSTLDSTPTCYDIDYGSLVSNGGTIDDCAGSSSSSSSSTASTDTTAQQGGGSGGRRRTTPTPSTQPVADPATGTVGTGSLFSDVPDDAWFSPFVYRLTAKRIISGYQDNHGKPVNLFGPADPVTYAQFAKMVMKLRGTLSGPQSETFNREPINGSARGSWAAPFVAQAESLSFSLFTPELDVNAPMSRAAVARTLLDFLNIEPLSQINSSVVFSDLSTSHPHFSALMTAVSLGLFSGDDNQHTIRPDAPLSRAEAAKLIALLLTDVP